MPNINFSKLFTLKYWLEGTTVGADSNISPVIFGSFFYYFYVGLFCVMLISAILIMVYRLFLVANHPLHTKLDFLSQNLIWMGILGITWFAARSTGISFIGSRIWLLFGLVWIISLLAWLIRYFIQFYKLEMAFFNRQASQKK